MIKGALIDFDGTLVNTHPFLYQVYIKFLRDRGKKGSQEEFDSLLGPSLKEIVAILVDKHHLEGSLETNYNAYYTLLMGGGGELLPGVLSFLRFAEANRIRLGVVTSAPKGWVEGILGKLNILRYFRFIVSAESLQKGKPSPDVYLEGIKQIGLPVESLIAIEDTAAGFQAAEGAGLQTYLPDWIALKKRVAEEYYPTLIQGPILQLIKVDPPLLSPKEEAAIEAYWRQKTLENNKVFNGSVYFFESCQGNALKIYLGDYKLFLGRKLLRDKKILPIAVGGYTYFKDKVLWGKRALNLAQFGGFWETVPSGGLAIDDPEKQLLIELEEEASISEIDVISKSFLKAVHNLKEGSVELLYRIDLDKMGGNPSEEVVEIDWLKEGDIPSYPVLPLSLLN